MNFKSILAAANQRLLHLVGRTPDQLWNRKLNRLMREVGPELEGKSRVLIDNFHQSAKVNHGSMTPRGHGEMNDSLICVQIAALKRMRCMNLVGFQPMTGPVCKVLGLQYNDDVFEPKSKTLSVVDGVAEAKIHKLQLRWAVEALIDNTTIHGVDIKSEIELASAEELALELDSVVVHKIKSMSTKLDPEEITDWQTLTVIIHRMRNGIASRSRRGAGNWVILPMDMFTLLQENPNYIHFPEEGSNGLRLMGELLGSPEAESGTEIYTNILEDDNTITVGYKGVTDLDTGFVYSPYIMAVPTGVTTDKDTFQMVQGFVTRHGDYEWNPENYYSSMEVLG